MVNFKNNYRKIKNSVSNKIQIEQEIIARALQFFDFGLTQLNLNGLNGNWKALSLDSNLLVAGRNE